MESGIKIPAQKSKDTALNVNAIRDLGRQYIEKISHQLWTDYNIHDPGVTTLELLSFAITDLAYRAEKSIPSLLVKTDNPLKELHEQFLTAIEILPNKALTINDYRKLFIDIDGVRNAWLFKADKQYWIDLDDSELTHNKPDNAHLSRKVKLNGLYDILIEYDPILTNGRTRTAILNDVRQTYNQNRNLCEDVESIQAVPQQEFIICGEIELKADAHVESVEAAIFNCVRNYLSPEIYRYSLKDLQAKGLRTDQIFDGPVLEHGFILDEEVEKANLRTEIRLSDIIAEIMKLDGVVGVKDLLINTSDAGAKIDGKNRWLIQVQDRHQAVLNIQKSRLVHYKDVLPFRANQTKVEEILEAHSFKIAELKNGLTCQDLKIEFESSAQAADHYSFINHFPETYGIGQIGLNPTATAERKAKAAQFKSYLLFFDQIIANLFAQLGNVSELFSTNPEIKNTYFSQQITSVKDSDDLWVDPSNLEKQLQEISETKERFFERRNAFLDHLLARFAEQFSEYAWITYTQLGNDGESANLRLINDKARFLSDYKDVSSRRAQAYNYSLADELWDTSNISGLQQRVGRLLGFGNLDRRNLFNVRYEIYQEDDTDGVPEYRFRVVDRERDKILISGAKHYETENQAREAMRYFVDLALKEQSYQIKTAKDGRHYFNIVDTEGERIARRIEYFTELDDLYAAITEVMFFVQNLFSNEGMFVVEHLLLRPDQGRRKEKEDFLAVCVDKGCVDCADGDPYSFRISVVLPCWTPRFLDIDFRHYVEKTIRLECPAHILPKICWIDNNQMEAFEIAYKEWLEYYQHKKSLSFIEQNKLSPDDHNRFIEVLSSLTTIYPESTLHDCIDGNGEASNTFLLNRTNLGNLNMK